MNDETCGGSRFAVPWSVDEGTESFVVKDATGQSLAYVYFKDEASADVDEAAVAR